MGDTTTIYITVEGIKKAVLVQAKVEIEMADTLEIHDDIVIDEPIYAENNDTTLEVEVKVPSKALQKPEALKKKLGEWLEDVLRNNGNYTAYSYTELKNDQFTMTAIKEKKREKWESSDDDDDSGDDSGDDDSEDDSDGGKVRKRRRLLLY